MNEQTAALAGDIGGTKTRLAVITAGSGPRKPLVEATFKSADFPSLESLTKVFLEESSVAIELACFGVAGPVIEGRATVTNLPWVMQQDGLAEALGVRRVILLNDLVSTAYGAVALEAHELHTLNEGVRRSGGVKAVVAPGTGLGEAYMVPRATGYRVFPSEGGHADFAPNTAIERDLLHYLQTRLDGHVSYERVCAGIGIPNIARFLLRSGTADAPRALLAALESEQDPTPIILDAALSATEPSSLCRHVLDTFVSILGAEAGNVGLKFLSTGGIYLGGGIPPRIIDKLDDGAFMKAFTNKGRMSRLLNAMPVDVILNPNASLLGVACHALEQLVLSDSQ